MATSDKQESSVRLSCRGRAFRNALYAGFWLTARIMFRVRVFGRERFANLPGTIYAGPHKRDADGIVGLATIFWASRGRGAMGRSVVMCGEHVFLPGFVAGYAVRRPRWLSFLLFPVRVAGLMWAMGWYPMPLARRRFLMAHLLDALEVVGDKPVSELFGARAKAVISGAPENTPISEAIRWPYRDALFTLRELSEFEPPIAERLWERQQARLTECLNRFIAVLDNGGSLFMAPEGILSPDGRMGRIRSGLYQLVQGAACNVGLQMGTITYDFTTTGRTTVFLHVGPLVRGAKNWTRDEFPDWIRDTTLRLTVVTIGYLAAVALRDAAKQGETSMRIEELAECIQRAAKQHAADGFTVDPRLRAPRPFRRRWRKFMAYCARKGMLDAERTRIHIREDDFKPRPAEGRKDLPPWLYSLNEIEGLASVSIPDQPVHGNDGG